MEKLRHILFLLTLMIAMTACGQKEDSAMDDDFPADQTERVVQASITQVEGNLIYVKPIPGSWELQSSSSFTLASDLIEKDADYEVGTVLEITYDGNIQETWPASFENITRVTVSDFKLPEDEMEFVDTASTASVGGPYGQISAVILGTWDAEAVSVDGDRLVTANGLYGLILKPKSASDGQIELFCTDTFGVCGTGLSSKEITLAGSIVHVGTFDEHEHWDFITFCSEKPQIVAMHTDCSSWTDEMWEEALLILDTVKFDESRKEGGIGRFIPESENDEIAILMEVSHVTPSGLSVRFRQYDKRDVAELSYGEVYTLERLEGDSWVEVPQITDNRAYTDIAYIIPAKGEAEQQIDWEWLYGKLPSGTYRIGKMVWDSSKTGHTMIPAYPLKAQFIIAD